MAKKATSSQTFQKIKEACEARWAKESAFEQHAGFHIARGTKWLPGLSSQEIQMMEIDLGVKFTGTVKNFLSVMNGTDIPGVSIAYNIPHTIDDVGFLSYPRDKGIMMGRMAKLKEDWKATQNLFDEIQLEYSKYTGLLPIFLHRYVVCSDLYPEAPVVSVYEADAIIYSDNLADYLKKECL